MYIKTKLTYADPVWGTHIAKSNWSKLEAAQNISLRVITNSPWFFRNNTLLTSYNLNTIKNAIINLST